MPFLILNRIPTSQEVTTQTGLEVDMFLEAFNKCSVSPFVAVLENKVIEDYNVASLHLGEWAVGGMEEGNVDWFTVVYDS